MIEECNKYWFDIFKEDLPLIRGIMFANGVDSAYLTDVTRTNSNKGTYQVMFYANNFDLESFKQDCSRLDLKGPPVYNNIFFIKCNKLIIKNGD